MISSAATFVLSSFRIWSVKLTARGRYPQPVQYSMRIFIQVSLQASLFNASSQFYPKEDDIR